MLLPAPDRHCLLTDELTSPVSSILSVEVVEAYEKIGGDFNRCVPFALLEARRYFRKQVSSMLGEEGPSVEFVVRSS